MTVFGLLFNDHLPRHGAFRRLLQGQVLSTFGGQMGALAVPTVAIVSLHASPMEVGILAALPWLPAPLVGLPVGVIIDRLPRRPVMIASEVGRWLMLAALAFGVLTGTITLLQLFVVATVTGILGVFFDTAYMAYVPATLEGDEILHANSAITVAKAPALVGGPALAGFTIQALGPAGALIANSAGNLLSGLLLVSIRGPEGPDRRRRRRSLFEELREGVDVVVKNPVLRTIATATGVSNVGVFMFASVSLVFAYRLLLLPPWLVGVVLAVGNLGFVLGAAAAPAWVRQLGLGRTLALSQLFLALSLFTAPLSMFGMPFVLLAASQLLQNVNSEIYNLNQVSLRQAMTPAHLQGRMNATVRVAILGAIPIGTLLGGYLGTTLGVVQTMLIGASICLLAPLFILSGPLIRLRQLETPPKPEPELVLEGQLVDAPA